MDFHGTLIKLGAGIMADHNKHLLLLLKKLNIKVNSFRAVRILNADLSTKKINTALPI
jgi:hypothetical protein